MCMSLTMALMVVLTMLQVAKLAEQANRHVPELRAYDRYGHRVDQVRREGEGVRIPLLAASVIRVPVRLVLPDERGGCGAYQSETLALL